jgi:hypothetical protein
MRRINILAFLSSFLFLLNSCCSRIDKKLVKENLTKFLSIEEVIKEKNSDWAFSNCGVSSSVLHFNLKTFNKLTIEFSPDCKAIFPMTSYNNVIDVYWQPQLISSKEYDIVKMIEKHKKHPSKTPFMRFRLINDSTISVTYYNRDFQNRLNSVDKQRILFPDNFHYLDSNRCKLLNMNLEMDTLNRIIH